MKNTTLPPPQPDRIIIFIYEYRNDGHRESVCYRERRERHVPEGDVTVGTFTTSSALSPLTTHTHTPRPPPRVCCLVVELETPTHLFLCVTHFLAYSVGAGVELLLPGPACFHWGGKH